jgi:hypothetical protein
VTSRASRLWRAVRVAHAWFRAELGSHLTTFGSDALGIEAFGQRGVTGGARALDSRAVARDEDHDGVGVVEIEDHVASQNRTAGTIDEADFEVDWPSGHVGVLGDALAFQKVLRAVDDKGLLPNLGPRHGALSGQGDDHAAEIGPWMEVGPHVHRETHRPRAARPGHGEGEAEQDRYDLPHPWMIAEEPRGGIRPSGPHS